MIYSSFLYPSIESRNFSGVSPRGFKCNQLYDKLELLRTLLLFFYSYNYILMWFCSVSVCLCVL
jgi:hypothetical protein